MPQRLLASRGLKEHATSTGLELPLFACMGPERRHRERSPTRRRSLQILLTMRLQVWSCMSRSSFGAFEKLILRSMTMRASCNDLAFG